MVRVHFGPPKNIPRYNCRGIFFIQTEAKQGLVFSYKRRYAIVKTQSVICFANACIHRPTVAKKIRALFSARLGFITPQGVYIINGKAIVYNHGSAVHNLSASVWWYAILTNWWYTTLCFTPCLWYARIRVIKKRREDYRLLFLSVVFSYYLDKKISSQIFYEIFYIKFAPRIWLSFERSEL